MIKDGKVRFYLIALIIILAIMLWIWKFENILTSDNIPDIAVEFHGMVFDIILFGVIVTIFEVLLDKKREIKRYKEEIDDFREWKEDEAKYRILGNIKRLKDKNVSQINLNNCYLEGLPIKDFKFKKSNFLSSTLENSQIINCSFDQSNLTNVNFSNSIILNSNFFYHCNLKNANFKNAIIAHVSFKGATFDSANFEGAKFFDVDFSGVDLTDVNLNGAQWDKSNFPYDFEPEKKSMIQNPSLYEVIVADDKIKAIQNKYDSPFIIKK